MMKHCSDGGLWLKGVAQEPILVLSLSSLSRPSDLLNLLLQNGVCITLAEVSMNMESVCGKRLGLRPALGLRKRVIGFSVVLSYPGRPHKCSYCFKSQHHILFFLVAGEQLHSYEVSIRKEIPLGSREEGCEPLFCES